VHADQGRAPRPAVIFGLWSTVLLASVVAALTGKAFIGDTGALAAIFAPAMIQAALEEGGSLVWCSPQSPAFCSRYIWLGL
jgi:hypothetical protein